jgi:hypothetical protein
MKEVQNKYYIKDFRKPMMLIALLQMIGMILIPVAIVLAFFAWKVAVMIGVVGVLMFWKFGDLNVELGHKWTKFSGSKHIDSKILYGDIENPDTAGKFRFVAEDIGGLYREGNEIVLGSLNGESRCKVEEFEYEIINNSALVNYINVKLGENWFSLSPKWDGPVKEQPLSPEKAEWGVKVINDLLNKDQTESIA